MVQDAILVGDAGGTNVRFALARTEGEKVGVTGLWKRPGADYPSFEDALDAFLGEATPKVSGAAFGFAGVVAGDSVELLNRGWTVDLAAVRSRLGLGRIVAVNDFFAMARSAPELAPDQARPIASGEAEPQGAIAVGGPGTGFGIAVLRWSPQGWIVVGGEGGHQAFSPQNEIEWKLAERLRNTVGYVSNEDVAAGIGFEATLAALNAVMALVANTTGGVYIAGGVALHLEPWLKERDALDRFYQRGVRSGLMQPIPIRLIASELAPLMGVAHLWCDEQARGWL